MPGVVEEAIYDNTFVYRVDLDHHMSISAEGWQREGSAFVNGAEDRAWEVPNALWPWVSRIDGFKTERRLV